MTDIAELVERLRKQAARFAWANNHECQKVCNESADALERMDRENLALGTQLACKEANIAALHAALGEKKDGLADNPSRNKSSLASVPSPSDSELAGKSARRVIAARAALTNRDSERRAMYEIHQSGPPPGLSHDDIYGATPREINAALRAEIAKLKQDETCEEYYRDLRNRERDLIEENKRLTAKVEQLKGFDAEAAEYVESVICMRTHFTGDPPYVGWKGLGLALNEVIDERNRLRAALEEIAGLANPLHVPTILEIARAALEGKE